MWQNELDAQITAHMEDDYYLDQVVLNLQAKIMAIQKIKVCPELRAELVVRNAPAGVKQ
jgi:hypothetical protein